MSKLMWDQVGQKLYETGVDRGVLFVQEDGTYGQGVVWNGLASVSESPSGAEPSKIYADNIAYLTLISTEEFAASVEAYMYPDEFAQCDGSAEIADGVMIGQQTRKPFALCYRTKIGNDVDGDEHGYKIHIIYNALAAPSERAYATVNDSPEAITFSWELSTTPIDVPGHKPTACLTIDSTKADATKLNALEDILYGSESEESRLPLPEEIITLMGKAAG